jgi:hypothetical protein
VGPRPEGPAPNPDQSLNELPEWARICPASKSTGIPRTEKTLLIGCGGRGHSRLGRWGWFSRLGDRGGKIAGRDLGCSGQPGIAELIREGRILHDDFKQINRGVSDFDEAVRTVLSPVPLFPR